MFFDKKNKIDSEKKNIVVIGTSPLAIFLIDLLQQNNIDVTWMSSLAKTSRTNGRFVVKNTSFQSGVVNLSALKYLTKKPEYCFLASDIKEYKSDVILLSDRFLENVLIVNFAYMYNNRIIQELPKVNAITAFFDGVLQKNKNTVQLLSHNYDFKINTIDSGFEQDLKLVLGGHKLDVDIVKNGDVFFEQKFVSYILINLLTAVYNKNISILLSNTDTRKLTDDAIKEMKKISIKKKIEIDSSKVLADIYAAPNGVTSDFLNKNAFLFVSDALKSVTKNEFPVLYEMLLKLSKNC
ncbi:MAG: hypothetical protein E7017_07150 [Alphaproteobacteria bacterium]|nr:hypothetical protein [Alphaproteobacteria bacterium]